MRAIGNIILSISFMVISSVTSADNFHVDTFETGNLSKKGNQGFQWTDATRTQIAQFPARIDSKSSFALVATYQAKQPWVEQRFKLGQAYPEVWIRYWLKVPTNFKHNEPIGYPTNNKFFAIWMDDYSAKGRGPSVVWEFWGNKSGGSKIAVHYSSGNFTITGSHLQLVPFINYPSDQGRWMQVVIHVKAASLKGAKDGVIGFYRRWADQYEFSQLHKLDNVDIAPPDTGPMGWKAGYFMGWSNPTYTTDTTWLIGDVEFSTTSLLDVPSPPTPPTLMN